MGLIDDLSAQTPPKDLERRKALGTITGVAFAAAAAGAVIETIRFLRPNVLFEPPSRIKVGRPEDIAVGTLLVIPEHRLYVVRGQSGVFAMGATCTHLGCVTRYEAEEKRIFCPCHGSSFAEDGAVTAGPAPKRLVRHPVTLERGQLVVDVSKTVSEEQVLEV